MADEIKNQAAENQEPEQSVNELRQIRVDKLTALQDAGKDPFQVTLADQEYHSTEIIEKYDELFRLAENAVDDEKTKARIRRA